MAEQQVFATKGNLILYKKALKLAALGYELLDRKRNILIRELMSLVDKAGELRGSIEDTYKEAYSALQLANISMGLVTPYANCIPVETGVEISTRSVMGVELPKVTLKERPLKVTYGFSQTDSQLDRAYLAFEKETDHSSPRRGGKQYLQTVRSHKKDTAQSKRPAKHNHSKK